MIKVQNDNRRAKIKNRVALLNMIPNVFWSCINLAPVFIFCYRNMQVNWVYFFSAISLLTIFLPRGFFNAIQLGKSTTLYKKIGVKFINRFTQNGDLINKLIRKKFPGYTVINNKDISHKKLLQQSYMFERFHFAMFTFFTLTTFFALFQHLYWWAVLLSATNLVYNVYPNLLQQYLRIRITSFNKVAVHK